jgi:hypothetical protein
MATFLNHFGAVFLPVLIDQFPPIFTLTSPSDCVVDFDGLEGESFEDFSHGRVVVDGEDSTAFYGPHGLG